MRVMLFHGWGFDASIWDAVVACLAHDACVQRAERGYFGAEPATRWPPGSRREVIAVGHSMGLLHALKTVGDDAPGAILAINGFTRFCAAPDWPQGVPVRIPARMRTRMRAAPDEVVTAFRGGHGAGGASPAPIMTDRLANDLDMLIEADFRAVWSDFAGPVSALSGTDDLLVDAAHARACFGSTLELCQGGHLLPLTKPDRCAAAIMTLAARL